MYVLYCMYCTVCTYIRFLPDGRLSGDWWQTQAPGQSSWHHVTVLVSLAVCGNWKIRIQKHAALQQHADCCCCSLSLYYRRRVECRIPNYQTSLCACIYTGAFVPLVIYWQRCPSFAYLERFLCISTPRQLLLRRIPVCLPSTEPFKTGCFL